MWGITLANSVPAGMARGTHRRGTRVRVPPLPFDLSRRRDPSKLSRRKEH
jgi:hypothetical protein